MRQGGWDQAEKSLGAVPGNLNPGGLLSPSAGVISAGSGNVITAGAGNVISAGAGNVISAGAGNVIAAGGGNVISAGGGNVISAGSGNVISAGSGNFQVRAAQAGASQAGPARAGASQTGAGPGFRATAQGVVLRLSKPAKGANVPVATGIVLLGDGEFAAGVKDARKSDVLHLSDDVWVLRQPPSGGR